MSIGAFDLESFRRKNVDLQLLLLLTEVKIILFVFFTTFCLLCVAVAAQTKKCIADSRYCGDQLSRLTRRNTVAVDKGNCFQRGVTAYRQ